MKNPTLEKPLGSVLTVKANFLQMIQTVKCICDVSLKWKESVTAKYYFISKSVSCYVRNLNES